jgi:hypothetical protein
MLFSHKELEEGEKFDVLSGIITGAYYWHSDASACLPDYSGGRPADP